MDGRIPPNMFIQLALRCTGYLQIDLSKGTVFLIGALEGGRK